MHILTESSRGPHHLLVASTALEDNMEITPPHYFDDLMSILKDSSQGITTIEVGEERPRIQEVPTLLREVTKNRDCYDPRLVSFGPYHHCNQKLQLGQVLKTRVVRQFFISLREAQSGKSVVKDFFEEELDQVAHEARDCYATGSTDKINDQDFKRLVFFDGCFIVYFIYCIVKDKQVDLRMKNDHIAFVTMDLFLLENQLPYMVLKALVTNFLPQDGTYIFDKFMELQTEAIGSTSTSKPRYQKVRHFFNTPTPAATLPSSSLQAQKEPHHLLDLLRTRYLTTSQPSRSQIDVPHNNGDNWQSFRSVQELKATGIKCSCTRTCCIRDVEFQSHLINGDLSLPALVIDDSTKTKWLNLIAYEACPDFSNDFDFTSFVCFMDSLIDHAEDVGELRSEGILLNSLGSDQKVAELFNDLTIDLTPNPSAYKEVKHRIEKHYKNKWSVWIAEAWRTNFRTPWTTTAFFAALFVIILTFLQTILTGVQTYYQLPSSQSHH
ncbi:UPF0481 protein At3g47200-like [Macadamia integrifolia]|uniref:UPF0481 protein At3g47200-like n=1 Tax=Macadamia integrifolia TaxID=60698 RepID=UPI001C4E3013|nr:UPF0481 protein At3g47200-like [Macadamia integrifolia]